MSVHSFKRRVGLQSAGAAALLLFAGLLPATAQEPSPVSITAAVAPVTVAHGGKGSMTVTLTIKPGWHVYAADPGNSDFIPTTVAATGADGVVVGKPLFPKSTTMKNGTDPKPLNVYQGKAVISVPFTVAKTAKAGKRTLTAKIGYQTCNDQSCLPPETVPVTAAVTIK